MIRFGPHTAFHGDTGGERERRGETALIPAHSMKGKNTGIPFRASCSMRPPFVCFSSSSADPLSELYFDTRINAPNDRFFFFFLPKKRLSRVFFLPSFLKNVRESSNRSIDRSIDFSPARSSRRSIRHDGATSFASVQPASPVSGRSGANRRIGGKMAKVSRESRGAALRPDQPTVRRILVLLAPFFHLKILRS